MRARLPSAPVVSVPGQRQSISAASAVSAKGAFWFATYAGGLNGALFVNLLRRMMRGRRRPLHLIVDGLPAHRTRVVRDYVDELDGKLTLHFLPGYAPDLNPDELAELVRFLSGPESSYCNGDIFAACSTSSE